MTLPRPHLWLPTVLVGITLAAPAFAAITTQRVASGLMIKLICSPGASDAGTDSNGNYYKHCSMNVNNCIYWVRGGMEDWAYAASWDKERMRVSGGCNPTTSSYPASRTASAAR